MRATLRPATPAARQPLRAPRRRRVALALQGGGAHGAFTWGVLDRLLQEERLEIEGLSGASAGAVNAVVLAHGQAVGGREGAREALRDFWEAVAQSVPFARLPDRAGATHALQWLGRFLSPAQFNPFDLNPLRDILARRIDFARLRRRSAVKLFVAATEVGSARLRLFDNADLSLDALLASACVPTLHHPIEIDGKAYWDGGLVANPPLYALIERCRAPTLVSVLLHPWRGSDAPLQAHAIGQRLTEIGFASTFQSQLHGIAMAQQAVVSAPGSSGPLERRLRNLAMQVIEDAPLMRGLGAGSRMNTEPTFLRALHQRGRRQAEAWLARPPAPASGSPARCPTLHRFLPDDAAPHERAASPARAAC